MKRASSELVNVPLTCPQVSGNGSRALTRRRVSGTVGLALCLGLLCSCVTERLDSRGVPIRSNEKSSARATAPKKSGAPEPLPASKPVGARSTISAVAVELRPIGVVPFDGLVLPIISPDGKFLATQTGTAPTWETLLATNRQTAADGLKIEVYDISKGRPARVGFAAGEGPPAGAILGRNADDDGFLIESPRPDGARWIGGCSWMKGDLRWRSSARDVCSGACLLPNGMGFAATHGGDPGIRRSVVATFTTEADDFRSLRDDRAEHFFPSFSSDGARLYTFAFTPAGLEIIVFDARRSSANAAIARRFLCPGDDPILAYQAAAGTQPVPYHPPGTPAQDADAGLLFFHSGERRMALFDPTTGAIVLLADGSIAGCWAHESDRIGVFITTPRGLVYQRLVRDGQSWNVSEPVRVLADPWVARSTTNPERPFILIGPGPRSNPNSLTIAAMKPVE